MNKHYKQQSSLQSRLSKAALVLSLLCVGVLSQQEARAQGTVSPIQTWGTLETFHVINQHYRDYNTGLRLQTKHSNSSYNSWLFYMDKVDMNMHFKFDHNVSSHNNWGDYDQSPMILTRWGQNILQNPYTAVLGNDWGAASVFLRDKDNHTWRLRGPTTSGSLVDALDFLYQEGLKMRMLSNGYMGVGNVTPTAPLHVYNTDGAERVGYWKSAGASHTAKSAYIEVANPAGTRAVIAAAGSGTGGATKDMIVGNWTDDGGIGFRVDNGKQRMYLDSVGRLSVGGEFVAQAGLDVTASQDALLLRAGNINTGTTKNQIVFGFNGTANYRHAIKSRHNSGADAQNALDFYTWQSSQSLGDIGTKHTLTMMNGFVGINGVTNPTEALDVTGNGKFSGNLDAVDGVFSGDVSGVNGGFSGNLTVDGIATFEGNYHQFGSSPSATRSQMRFVANQEWAYIQVGGLPAAGAPKKLRISEFATVNTELTDFEVYAANTTFSGATTVGSNATNANLTVYGTARVKELYIDDTETWADFVFDPNYRLRPLSEVEAFIEENQHLPEVPSAEEVAETGYSQTDLNATLLQKVEELTLYMIALQKENEALKARLDEVESRD